MIIVCTSSADTYITDKIIRGSFRAEDANVGRASTIDIFKLYDETMLNGSSSQVELSRGLLKFDFTEARALTGSIIDINSNNFKAVIEMKDIMTGHMIPRNFTLSIYPLSKSFDEGSGLDTGMFDDVHVANFLTASYGTSSDAWFVSGANAAGLLGSNNIDYIASGNLNDGLGITTFESSQTFVDGYEDLSIDVTRVVSGILANQIPDCGFRLSFTGSQETDNKTRFEKRFASRHVSNPILQPKLFLKFNDSIHDDHQSFYFDLTGTLFLNSYEKSSSANIVSGSNLSEITGSNCLILQINKGDYNLFVTGSQHTAGTGNNFVTGLYSASFAIPSSETQKYNKSDSIAKLLVDSGEVEFTTYWKSLDKSITYHTGSFTMKRPVRTGGSFISRSPQIIVSNAKSEYRSSDTVRFRLFGRDLINEDNTPVKRRYTLPSIIYDKVYYQVTDRVTKQVIIPYDSANNSTLVSTDTDGMFFDFKMQVLIPGRSYTFDFYVVDRGSTYIIRNDNASFTVRD